MTKNEAIQIIEKMPISHECREFFDMVLKALKQPEIVKCKDCSYKHEQKGTCHNVNSICFGQYVNNNWFCADGKHE